MFKKLSIILLLSTSLCYAGTISRTSPSKATGDTYTAAELNGDLDTIYSEINGNLDSNNLENNAVTTEKLTADAVTPAKIDDDNINPVRIRELTVTTGITASSVTATTLTTSSTGTLAVANITTIENSPIFTYGLNSSTITVTSTATLVVANITTIENSPTFTYGLSAGTITLTAQPCARAYLSTDQDDIGTASRIVQFKSENYDVANNFDTTTSSFTATIAGYYQVNASVFFEATDMADGESMGIAIRKNNTEYSLATNASNGAIAICQTISDIIPLAVGDTLALYFYSTRSTADIKSGTAYTYMSIRLVQ